MKMYTESEVEALLVNQRKICADQIDGSMFGTVPSFWKKKIIEAPMPVNFISTNPHVISCTCQEEDKHGSTKIWCCNHCGLSTEDWWGKY